MALHARGDVIVGKDGEIHSLPLRDWLAAMAMQGLLANPDTSGVRASMNVIAKAAYEAADAMIAESSKDSSST
jgi:hypothetical protein